MSVRVPCLLCNKRDSVASIPIVGGFIVQCCGDCHARSQTNRTKAQKKNKSDLCSQCYYNKAKRTVLYRDERIATLYTKLERATQLIVNKDYERARQRLRRLVAECPGLFAAHYNLACIDSITGNAMDALTNLEMAFKTGYQNFDNVKRDPDLNTVRKQGAFKAMFKQYEKNPVKPSREVVGQLVTMCDVCAEVLASTSIQAKKNATAKNLCEQCRQSKAVVKVTLPDGKPMKLCSECAQSVSAPATGGASSSGPSSQSNSGTYSPTQPGTPQPAQPDAPAGSPGPGGPPPVAPRRRAPDSADDRRLSAPSAPLRLSGEALNNNPPPPEHTEDDEDAAAPPPHPEDEEEEADHDDPAPPPPGPKRMAGAVALMPGIQLPMRPARRTSARRGPGGPPGRPARRLTAQRGAPPVASRRGPPPAARRGGVPPTPTRRGAPAAVRGGAAPAAAAAAAAPAAGGEPAPLPAGWKEYKDKKTGRAYYYSASTKETVWVRPTKATVDASAAPAAAPAAAADAPLPAGWKEFTDKKTGRKYYYCSSTKETIWTRPKPEQAVESAAAVSPAKPAAAAATPEPAPVAAAAAEPAPVAAAAEATPAASTVASAEAKPPAASTPPPLPEGWVEYMDKKRGIPYYYNKNTKETVWIRPAAATSAPAATPTAQEPAAAAAAAAAAEPQQPQPEEEEEEEEEDAPPQPDTDSDDDDQPEDALPSADLTPAAPGEVTIMPLSDSEDDE